MTATLDAMRTEKTGNGPGAAWVTVVAYENLPGCPRPAAALRA